MSEIGWHWQTWGLLRAEAETEAAETALVKARASLSDIRGRARKASLLRSSAIADAALGCLRATCVDKTLLLSWTDFQSQLSERLLQLKVRPPLRFRQSDNPSLREDSRRSG